MPFSSHQVFFQVIHCSQHITHVIATPTCIWAYVIGIRVAMEVVEEAQQVAVERAARCVSVSFYSVSADIPQSESNVQDHCGRVLHRP